MRTPLVIRLEETAEYPKERTGKSASHAIIFSLVVAFIFLGSSVSFPWSDFDSKEILASSYTPHIPMSINGDLDFSTQASSESWNGSGTAGDPYIIENYEIDVTSSSCGIIISNTQSHFVIRNCSIYSASIAAIELLNVVNGTISNNTCFNNTQYGIYLVTSNLNSILENNCSDNGAAGVCLQSSTDCAIENNTCDRGFRGIYIYSSSDRNRLANNSCSDQAYGILIYTSSSCTLRDNQLNGTGIVLWGSSVGYWNSHDIDSSNTVNGGPVRYLKDLIGTTVQSGAGQVILANCQNVIVENQNTSDATYGIEIGYSRNCTVSNNSCWGNWYYGIVLVSSDNNTLRNNTCGGNGNFGIYLSSSNLNNVTRNILRSNTFYAIYLLSSSSNLVLNNSCSGEQVGIYIDACTGITMRGNEMEREGIYIYGLGMGDWIMHTIDTSNEVNGRPVYYYSKQSGITVPSGAGQVILANCTSMTIDGQNLTNASVGVEMGFSDRNIVSNSSCSFDSQNGILLISSSNNTIVSSIFANNSASTLLPGALFLYVSSDNTIRNNWFTDNLAYGVCLYTGSNRNHVWNNSFYRNNGATSVPNFSNIQGYDSGSGNRWNTSKLLLDYGNFWGDWTFPDNVPPPSGDGRVDLWYNLHGSAANFDCFPLTTSIPIPEPPVFVLAFVMTIVFLVIVKKRS